MKKKNARMLMHNVLKEEYQQLFTLMYHVIANLFIKYFLFRHLIVRISTTHLIC